MRALLMEALITSCGRMDLLKETLESFQMDQVKKVFITIHEDGLSKIGQHVSIETFLQNRDDKYYVHLEDDWKFENHFDWIQASILIMKENPRIIKVLCRADSPHPCTFDNTIRLDYKKNNPNKTAESFAWGYVEPWESRDKILWHGFSWNPGVTRLDLLKRFIPFGKWEQDVAKDIYDEGYQVAMLQTGVCTHIGDNRSTHL